MELKYGTGAVDALEKLAALPEQSSAARSEVSSRLAAARALARNGVPDHYKVLGAPRNATADEVWHFHLRGIILETSGFVLQAAYIGASRMTGDEDDLWLERVYSPHCADEIQESIYIHDD